MREHNYKIAGVDLFAHRTEALSAVETVQLSGRQWPQAPLDDAAQDGILNSLAVGAARSYRYFKGIYE